MVSYHPYGSGLSSKNKDYTHARQELQRNLSKAEKLGLRLQNAKIHFLMGRALRLGGTTSEAPPQYREALRLLDEIRKEPGAEHIIERFDQKVCVRGSHEVRAIEWVLKP